MMMGPAGIPAGSNTVAPLPYRYGPWLVAHDVGGRAETCALSVHTECGRRGFDGPRLSIAAAGGLHLDRYRGLIVIPQAEAPSPARAADLRALLARSEDLVLSYRARRRNGLLDLISGKVASYDAGVVQVIGSPEVLDHPAAQRLLKRACVHHSIDDLTDLSAIFDVYTRDVPGIVVPDSGMVLAYPEVHALWELLAAWGVTHADQVPALLDGIEQMREVYESETKPALRRPIHGVAMNRLDFILDAPDRVSELASWTPDGARVVRQVVEHLHAIVPTLTNPAPTRGSTRRFSAFYNNLKNFTLCIEEAFADNVPDKPS